MSELLKLNLDCDSVYSEVVVAVLAQLSTDDKTFLGNDLAGGLGFNATPKVTSHPQVINVPDEFYFACSRCYPRHVLARKRKIKGSHLPEINLSDTFMANSNLDLSRFGTMVPSHDQLVSEQRADPYSLCSA